MQSFWEEMMMTCRIDKKQITCNKESKTGLEGGEDIGNMVFIGQSPRARLCIRATKGCK